ncbi:hypothetical protein L13192_03745 [Pyrenophora tritici-repentis]|uniref:Uncharacterized protein n=1 Tax=Pyrenophora tritici-repentis TaxID=45151 RepID=A0A922T0T2_9PLEO|nr:hypothetical protein Ptr86124_006256 [Pyrenophora tritici-repentis]KAI1672886.1 hypothetical protein L13192_03745 [Pyrenophora tritici-repentis]KAI1677314.1 hypothetical protein KJE20_13403 [Pyrenophora tritici-repentis]
MTATATSHRTETYQTSPIYGSVCLAYELKTRRDRDMGQSSAAGDDNAQLSGHRKSLPDAIAAYYWHRAHPGKQPVKPLESLSTNVHS